MLTIEIWDSRSAAAYEVDQNINKKGKYQASVPKPKNFDVFIGKVSIPVRDVSAEIQTYATGKSMVIVHINT